MDSIRGFYHYLIEEEQVAMVHPVKRGYALRLSRPLPRHLRDEEVGRLLKVIHDHRDRALFMLMLRCGLRVEEVARLKLAALDLRRSQVFVHYGKGAKDRVVYLSADAYEALVQYLRVRPASRVKEVFLVNKGRCRGQAISVRGIQKRLEHYARQARLKVSCHQLRHTMATPTPQCRRGPGDHPGSSGAYPDQNHPALLPGVQSQGAAGLPPGHDGGAAEDRIRYS
jgi:site-specific recombinase XerD